MPSDQVRKELNPLWQPWNGAIHRTRMLTDRGIRTLVEQPHPDKSLFLVEPPILPDQIHQRIQPTSIDVRIQGIEQLKTIDSSKTIQRPDQVIIPPGHAAECQLVDSLESACVESHTPNHEFGPSSYLPFHLESVARSSIVRSGLFDSLGVPFLSGPNNALELANLSNNSVSIPPHEAVGQIFVKPDPYFDHYEQCLDPGQQPINTDLGDFVRSLDMGVEIRSQEALQYLALRGLYSVPRDNGKEFAIKDGYILLHAKSSAKRMKQLDEPLDFSRRKEYQRSGALYEDIDISHGYTVQENETIVVDAQESLELSPHIGMMLYEQIRITPGNINPKHDEAVAKILAEQGRLPASLDRLCATNITWADPGYNGIMTGLPKLPGLTVYPGDIIGLLRVFYFPNGVELPYGAPERNSQYQGQQQFQVGAT